MKKIIDKCKDFGDFKIYIVLFKLIKGYLLLISDKKEMGLGEITLATPNLIDGLESRSFSQKFISISDSKLSNVIAEKVSYKLRNPALVLLFLDKKLKDSEIAKPLISYLNDCLSEESNANSENNTFHKN